MKKITLALLFSLAVLDCLAWGQKGHDVTCTIAQRHLTKKASKRIAELLDGKSIIYWANWLDDASNTPAYAYSKTWHYKNVDANETYETARPNENGDIVKALNQQISDLKGGKLTREQQVLALKMVIHLMGDLHQPLHLGHLSDLGGNKWHVNYFRSDTNLHSVWDTSLPESTHKWTHNEWAEELDRLSKDSVQAIQQGTIDDWARETYVLCGKVYEGSPIDGKLSYSYVSKWGPEVENQLLRGGLRLAAVLNEIFK